MIVVDLQIGNSELSNDPATTEDISPVRVLSNPAERDLRILELENIS